MRTSETVDQLLPALAKAIPNFGAVLKSASNPHFRSKYVPLDGLVDAVAPALHDQGLLVFQGTDASDDAGLTLLTRLYHVASGQWIENAVRMPLDKATPQGAGSALTYGRRYGLTALLCLVADEDDDGNAASQPKPVTVKNVVVGGKGPVMPIGEHKGQAVGSLTNETLERARAWALAQPTGHPDALAVIEAVSPEMRDRGLI